MFGSAENIGVRGGRRQMRALFVASLAGRAWGASPRRSPRSGARRRRGGVVALAKPPPPPRRETSGGRNLAALEELQDKVLLRLQRRLSLWPVEHAAACLGGSSSFQLQAARGRVRGYGNGASAPWVACSELSLEGESLVRWRVLALASEQLWVPHLEISLNASEDASMFRLDLLPRVDLVCHVDYFDRFYGENQQNLWQQITQQATAVYVNPDARARLIESPCCVSVILRNDERTVAQLGRTMDDAVELWMDLLEEEPRRSIMSPGAEVELCKRNVALRKAMFAAEQAAASDVLLDGDFAVRYAQAMLGPNTPPLLLSA